MNATDTSGAEEAMLPPLPVYLDARAVFARSYLIGSGLEIGPLHQPLATPPHANVRYVDRMTTEELRREYPELIEYDLTPVDIVDDGEKLATIADESEDFIVANHMLEHTEDPVGTILTHLSKLRPGGVLFYAVPDKRFTFDFRRPVTPIEHMFADHKDGPERSRAEHFREWSRLVIDQEPPADTTERSEMERVEARAQQLEGQGYSIHMHVWTQAEFLRLILALRDHVNASFDLEAAARVGIEFIVVLRKAGPLPAPPLPSGPTPLKVEMRTVGRRFVRRAKEKVAQRWAKR